MRIKIASKKPLFGNMVPKSILKFSLFIFLLSCCSSILAQKSDSLGFTDKAEAKNLTVHGLKVGKWCEYNISTGTSFDLRIIEDTASYSLTIYIHNKAYGLVHEYYPSGKLLGIHHYMNNGKPYIEKEYYESGKLWTEGPYTNGMRNGIIKEHSENGEFYYEHPYMNGELNGIDKCYFASGQLECETPYSNGEINGVRKSYFENGKLAGIDTLIYGKLNGVSLRYYENGQLSDKIPFTNNEVNGVQLGYYKNGNLKWESPQANGERIGPQTLYYESGKIHWKNNTEYDEFGNVIPYDSVGFSHPKNIILNGKKEGRWIEYLDSNSNVTTDTNAPYYRYTLYKNGEPDGFVRQYYQSGSLQIETHYKNGAEDGLEKRYDKTMELKSETYYNNGKAGITNYFDENGNEIKQ